MIRTTLGQLWINEQLPPDMVDYDRVLDKKGVKNLFNELATKHPDKYKEVAQKLLLLGEDAGTTTGSYSFGLQALRQTAVAKKTLLKLEKELDLIYRANAPQKEKEKRILELAHKYRGPLVEQVLEESVKEHNPLALQALSGAKGSKINVNSLRGADILYGDHRGRAIPIPVLHSYSQGLRPHEYVAGAFGARKGVIDLANATRDAGYLAKQLNQMTHRLVVEADEDDSPYDETIPRGYPVETDDADSEGALLSHPIGGYKRNTVITPRILKDLKDKGHDEILVRSPMVGGPGSGGVYSKDVGYRERGRLAPRGDLVGMAAGQSISEPVTQMQISSKHCLAGDTLVRMADFSTRRICDVIAGEWIMGADVEGNTFPVQVIRVYANGEKLCYRTTFRQAFLRDATENRDVISTLDHKIAGIRRCSSQKDEVYNHIPSMYAIGQRGAQFAAVAPAGLVCSSGDGRPEPLAALVGALLGDGCYTKSVNGCYFKCHDPAFVSDLRASLPQEHNVRIASLHHHDGTYYRISQWYEAEAARDTVTGKFTGSYRNPVMQWLDSRGMLHKYAHEKTLPPDIDTWDTPSVAALLGGLFAADGSVFPVDAQQKWGLNFGSTSKQLRDQVRRLLELRFGIYGSIAESPYGDRVRPMFYLDINHAVSRKRFLHKIPLYGCKRSRICELEAKYPAADTHLHMKFIRKSQQPVGMLPTYDLEVDHPSHLFVLANGIIVSNSGGVVGAGHAGGSGFAYINSLVQVPKIFPGGASHAQIDGRVNSIQEAPQGGHYVTVGSEKHYVGHQFPVTVKIGDHIEAGDTLSEGLPNPGEVVKHKGIGEGRRYLVKAFREALQSSGTGAHRRNLELMARGLINHVRLTDEIGDWVPDDVVPYHMVERNWQPREGHAVVNPKQAVGQYLERPILHYTVGTRIQPSMLKQLERHGVKQVYSHRDPPPFQPEMIRSAVNVAHDPDWMTRMLGSYQQKHLLTGVHRGDVSDESGTSFVPGLARGEHFGRTGKTKTWDPNEQPYTP